MKNLVFAGLCIALAFLAITYGIMLVIAIGSPALMLSFICLSGAAWWMFCARWFVQARIDELDEKDRMKRRVYWQTLVKEEH